jgi:hypothetical protein
METTGAAASPAPGRRRGGGQWVFVVVVLAVVLLAIGLVALQRRHPPVVLLGDSITELAKPAFEGELGGEYDLHVSGVAGHRTDQRVPVVPELAAAQPRQVVINLGTNDVLQRRNLDETERDLEAIGAGFGSSKCVHLVTVVEAMFSFEDAGLHDRAVDLNDRIRGLAARRGWRVIPWDRIIRDYDAAGQPQGPWSSDTVHPTPEAGQPLLINGYREALASCPP